jgi:lipopolysaccharide/colanic/teichoic acid biosynthesis glycosyltransferase
VTAASKQVREASQARGKFPYLSGLSAQRQVEFLTLRLAPALTGGLIAYQHLSSEWSGVLVFACMFAAVMLMRSSRYPLHLIPLASALVYLLAPPIGALGAVLISISDGASSAVTLRHVAAPILGAWVVTGVGAWITHRFRSDREVRVAVIGSHEFARGLRAELKAVGVKGYQVIGCIDPKGSCDTAVSAGVRCLGSLVLLRQTVLDNAIELVVLGPLSAAEGDESVVGGPSRLEVFETAADACLDLPVSLIESGQLYERLLGHVPLGTTTSAWFQYMLHPDYKQSWPLSKRLFDIVLGAAMAVVAAPLVAIAAIAIKLDDRGPIFYRQTRVGEGGREFDLLKMRTLHADADSDPRPAEEKVTSVGRVLQRLHINELPQIWQVLKGDMSLVGPRPEQPHVVASLEAEFHYYDRRHLVKPGITGWATVRCGYSGTPIGEAWKLCHDLYYLKRRSLFFDLLIMMETVSAIFVPEPMNRPDERFIVAYRSDTPSASASPSPSVTA